MSSSVQIIIADWMGYPLKRRKKIKNRTVKCGLGRFLKQVSKYNEDIDFECTLIINANDSPTKKKRLYEFYQPANTRETYLELANSYPFVTSVQFRDNRGMDIGAYSEGLGYLRTKNHIGDVLFLNSSVAGPAEHNWLSKYRRLLYAKERAGLVGISLNSSNTCLESRPFAPHVQSFFLYTNMDILNQLFPNGFNGANSENPSCKDDLVLSGEIGISEKFLAAGYGICSSTFPGFYYYQGDEWSIPEGDIRFNKCFNKLANKI